MDEYLHLLMLASLSVRSSELVQEVLLVLHECRADVMAQSPMMEYAHKHALGITFDRAEEAADECPCNDQGRPKKPRGRGPPPATVRLVPVPDEPTQVIAHVRVDEPTPVRIHSHVRLQAVSDPEKGWVGGKAGCGCCRGNGKEGRDEEWNCSIRFPRVCADAMEDVSMPEVWVSHGWLMSS
jgi:hypothetical protein